jgi:hypothetical protein
MDCSVMVALSPQFTDNPRKTERNAVSCDEYVFTLTLLHLENAVARKTRRASIPDGAHT